jgi:hypothetical protein
VIAAGGASSVEEGIDGEVRYTVPNLSEVKLPSFGAGTDLHVACPAERCTRTHSYRRTAVVPALDSAVKYGRKVLVLGIDL